MADLKLIPLRGLHTSPGALSAAPVGSMELCQNIVFRKPGVLEPLPASVDVAATPFGGYTVRRMLPSVAGQPICIAQNGNANDWLTKVVTLDIGTPNTVSLYGAEPEYRVGQIQQVAYPSEAGSSLVYLTSGSGLIRVEESFFAFRAGMPAPMLITSISASTTDARAVVADQAVNYRAIFRVIPDFGRPEYTSPPCTPTRFDNLGGPTRDPNIRIGWIDGLDEITTGSGANPIVRVELYRTRGVPSGTDPGDTMFLVSSKDLTVGDIAVRHASISDHTTDDELGQALYTNTGEEGIAGAHNMPPMLADVCEYKGTLYGIATAERQSLSLTIPGPMGELNSGSERKYGVGSRVITGDTTIGLPTISGISANHMKGIAIGQRIVGNFVDPTYVLSFGVSTIVADTNATSTVVGASYDVLDQISIDGTQYDVQPLGDMMQDLQGGTSFKLDIQLNRAVSNALQSGLQINLARPYVGPAAVAGVFGVTATNGDRYAPRLDTIGGTEVESSDSAEVNSIAISAPQQPDSWPLGLRETIGNQPLIRLVSTAEAMFAFASDGRVYRISGQDLDLQVDCILEGTRLASANAVVAFGGSVYAWTSRGVMSIGDGGMSVLSDPIRRSLEADYFAALTGIVGSGTVHDFVGQIEIESFYGEIWLRTTLTGAFRIYNITTGEWSDCTDTPDAFTFDFGSQVLAYFSDAGEGTELRRFVDVTSSLKFPAPQFRLNRLSGDEPGLQKQFREVVLLYQAVQSGYTLAPEVSLSIDAAMGPSGVTTTESVPLSTDGPMPYTINVGSEAGSATQWWLEHVVPTGDSEWALDGIIVRVDGQVDRTGRSGA